MSKSDYALELFIAGASCAQSILVSFGTDYGLSQEQCFKLGAGLGGGLGRKQYICGALNAGAIILGLKFGNSNIEDTGNKEKTSKIVWNFITECEKELGNSQCSNLLNFDLTNDDQRKIARENGLFDKVCNNAVVKTAIILEKYLKTDR